MFGETEHERRERISALLLKAGKSEGLKRATAIDKAVLLEPSLAVISGDVDKMKKASPRPGYREGPDLPDYVIRPYLRKAVHTTYHDGVAVERSVRILTLAGEWRTLD